VTGQPFEEVAHTADLALRVRGVDLAALMLHAAQGMLSLIQAVPAPGQRQTTSIALQSPDRAELLVRWLEELLFRMETQAVAFTAIHVTATGPSGLQATIEEAPLASIGRAIKAVTYHGLAVRETPAGLEATIVFDV